LTSLIALGSGSRGNCFALEHEGAVLLVDAGFSARELQKRAERAGLSLGALAGIALTHEHGDHACGALKLAQRTGAPILASPGTWAALSRAGADGVTWQPIGSAARAEAWPFSVWGCPIAHDAAEPLAVAVELPDGVRVGVAYDLGRPTSAVRYLLRQLTAIIIEANHDEVLLRTSGYPPSVQQRIAGSAGHLSNRAAAEVLVEAMHPGLATVVLAHLSQRCNEEQVARATVEAALRRAGFTGGVYVARQDEPVGPVSLARSDGAQLVML
jgi:phosphoribosyl 1,2-cyclic phosphodiesterase